VARLVQPRDVGPRAVTLAELRGVLLPLCAGWSWAEGAILDLWKLGAPTPDSGPGVPERRILLPGQFARWWGEVAARTGREGLPREVLHVGR
jgi:hypothetical protein